jgi:hypothetical protein
MEDGSMDGKQFDDLARWLAAVRSRRTITRLLGAGALVAPLAAWGWSDAEAKKDTPKKRKVCLCSPASCTTKRVKNRARVIRQNAPCAYAGGCTTNPCAARPTTTPTTAVVPTSCRPAGEPCTLSRECCESAGLVCLNEVCDCLNAADPCGGECCGEDQFCEDDSCVPCLEREANCTSDAQCCNGDCHTYNGRCNPDV